MYNHKTGKFTKLNKMVRKLYDELQEPKDRNELMVRVAMELRVKNKETLVEYEKLRKIRDKSVELFLKYGIFGDDVEELRTKSNKTSWYLRRNKVLSHYLDLISTWAIMKKNEVDKKKETLKELKRIMKDDDEWKDKGEKVMNVLFKELYDKKLEN